MNYMDPKDKSYQQPLFINNCQKLKIAADTYKNLQEAIMGEFPVVSISFKTVEGRSFVQAVSQLLYKIGMIYDEIVSLGNLAK